MLFKKITSFFQQKSEVPVCEKLRAFDAPRYAVEQYQIDSFVRMTGMCEFRGKRILEIGGSNLPVELTRDCLGAKEWVCVDNSRLLLTMRKVPHTMPVIQFKNSPPKAD